MFVADDVIITGATSRDLQLLNAEAKVVIVVDVIGGTLLRAPQPENVLDNVVIPEVVKLGIVLSEEQFKNASVRFVGVPGGSDTIFLRL